MEGATRIAELERLLAEDLREIATELRMIDVVEFVSYIRLNKVAHIDNLVSSAAEGHFRPGTLSFSGTADLHLDWGAAPTIWLDLRFRNKGVEVNFSLILESCSAAIEINMMPFAVTLEVKEEYKRLQEALADARNLAGQSSLELFEGGERQIRLTRSPRLPRCLTRSKPQASRPH